MPTTFRDLKAKLRISLNSENYPESLEQLTLLNPKKLINPLLACLLLPEPSNQRAATLLGETIHKLTKEPQGLEEARNFMRRLIWQMNEESGNIAWGIPLAFAAILSCNATLAQEYHKIFFSYIWDTGHDDNYCDYAPLRQSYYAGIIQVCQAHPNLAKAALPALSAAQTDPDTTCQILAKQAWQEIQLVL